MNKTDSTSKVKITSPSVPYRGHTLSIDKEMTSKNKYNLLEKNSELANTYPSLYSEAKNKINYLPKEAMPPCDISDASTAFFKSTLPLLKQKIKEARNKLSFGLYFCSFLSTASNETRKTLLNEIKSLENQLCKNIKALYGKAAQIELQTVKKKGWDTDKASILTIEKCRKVRGQLTDLWNEGVKESLISKPKEVSSSSGKRWECYEDNWTYWMSMPELPSGIKQDFAFAVVNTDGSFDPNYPVFTSPWATDASLAIGGWNNSQSTMPSWGTNGFYTLVESIDPNAAGYSTQESNFINAIDNSLKSGNGSWTSVCLDFENYGDELANTPGKYTKLVKDVYKFLADNHPDVKLKMCMSPNAKNRRYFDLKDLLNSCPNLTFQPMCYDYALGQVGTTRVIPNDAIYGPEYDYINNVPQETIQTDLITLFNGDGTDANPPVPQNRVYLGVPEYGIIYNLNPEDCTSPEEVLAKINDNWSLKANEWNPYGSDNGQITNEQILSTLGGDWTPSSTCGWVTLVDNWGKTYYYNQSRQQVIAATPPDSLDGLMGDFVRKNYPNILGFFGWEAIGDNVGKSMQTFMNQFEAFSTSFSTKAYHVFRHCMQILSQTFNRFLGIKPLTGSELAKRMLSSGTAGESCYIDMGILYGQWVYTNAIIWWPEPVCLDQTKIDDFLGDFFEQLKRDGVSDLRYSFEQMCDIFNIPNHVQGPWSDPISLIYYDNFEVGTSGRNFLEYMCDRSVEQGFTNTMSFGGVAAAGSDWVLPGDGVTCANTFVQFMKDTNIQSVDFDVEGPDAISQVQTDNSKAFFTSLKEQQAARGGKSTITLIGDINQKPEGLFNSFDSYFDGVSLMLYSTEQYYIDATGNYSWGLDQWQSAVGGDTSKLSIGFFDKIAYEDQNSSAGKKYNVSGTRGQSAAQIYIQAAKDLGVTLDEFSPPFWWTDDPTTLPDNTILEDFYEYLGQSVESSPTLTKSDKIKDFIRNKKAFSPSDRKFYIALGKLVGKVKKTPLTEKNHFKREKKLPWKGNWMLGKNYQVFKTQPSQNPNYVDPSISSAQKGIPVAKAIITQEPSAPLEEEIPVAEAFWEKIPMVEATLIEEDVVTPSAPPSESGE